MNCERIDSANREVINTFIRERWYTTVMVIRGRQIDMTATEGFFLREQEKVMGLIT